MAKMKRVKIKVMGWVILIPILTAGCQKNVVIPITQPYSFSINQRMPTHSHPADFYLCGNYKFPCHSVTNRWQGHANISKAKKYKKKVVDKNDLSIKKLKEKSHEDVVGKNNCVAK